MSVSRILSPVAGLLVCLAASANGAPRPVAIPLQGCVDRRMTLNGGHLRLLDTRRRSVIYTYSDAGIPGDLVVRTSPVCGLFTVRDPGRQLQVVSAETGVVLRSIPAEEGADTAEVTFSPAVGVAALVERESAAVRKLSLINGETGAVVSTLNGLRNLNLWFSPEGDALGLWEMGWSFRILAGQSGAERFYDPGFNLSQAAAAVEVSADCALFRLIEASEDDPLRRTLRVVDGETGQVLSQITPEEDETLLPRCRLLSFPVDPSGAGIGAWSVSDSGVGLASLETGKGEGAEIAAAEVQPRTQDPVLFQVAPTRINTPFRAEATAVDAAGNCRHCLVIGSALRTQRGRPVVTQIYRNVPPTLGEVLLLNGTPGAWLVQVTANRRSFRTVLQDGQRRTLDISDALTRDQNSVSIRVMGRPGAGLNFLLQEPTGL